MSASERNTYVPGVCNIGPAEIGRRRRSGWFGLGIAAAFLVLAFVLEWPPAWRLLVFLPVFLAAQGFLQAAFHFCVGFASRGLFNFGELGTEQNVLDAEFRKADQRKAVQITLYAFLIAAAAAVVAFLV